jgi:large subunit ribosomal protein L9
VKVILTENVPGLGESGKVLEVSKGYAENYLIPKGLAKKATEATLRELEEKSRRDREKEEKARKEAEEKKRILEEKPVVIKVKAGEKGKLFSSISGKEIAEAILKQRGIKIDKKEVEVEKPIKEVGEFKVQIRVYSQVKAEVNLVVEAS